MIDFRLPSITGATPQEQITQLHSFLVQFIGQLQFELGSIENMMRGEGQKFITEKSAQKQTLDVETSFHAIKPLIIKSTDIFNAYYKKAVTLLADIVTESGTYATQCGGEWSYKKWSDGTYQMFGAFTVTLSDANDIAIEVPFPVASAFISGTAANNCYVSGATVSEDCKSITIHIVGDVDTSTAGSIELKLLAVGRYVLPQSDENVDGEDGNGNEESNNNTEET